MRISSPSNSFAPLVDLTDGGLSSPTPGETLKGSRSGVPFFHSLNNSPATFPKRKRSCVAASPAAEWARNRLHNFWDTATLVALAYQADHSDLILSGAPSSLAVYNSNCRDPEFLLIGNSIIRFAELPRGITYCLDIVEYFPPVLDHHPTVHTVIVH